MRIGLVSYEYPPQKGLGGVGSYMFRLAGALGRAGHDVHVIAGPSDRPAIEQPNVTLHRYDATYQLDTSSRIFRFLYWRLLAPVMAWMHPSIYHWIRWDLATYRAIQEIDAKFPLDLIEAPEHAANGWMAERIHRWPIVVRMHLPWEVFIRGNRQAFNPLNRVLSMLERRTVHGADAVTVPSEAMNRELNRLWHPRRPAIVVPNFMDVPAEAYPLPPEDEPQQIMCAGRIEPFKGQDTLCRAFAKIAGRHPRARLMLIGPDQWPGSRSFRQILPDLVPDAEIRARIDMLGPVPLEKINEMLRQVRIAVVASSGTESFCYSALEALAAARPVIATTAGALPEMIRNEQTGLTVAPGNDGQFAAALDRLLGDRALCQRLATAGHGWARETYDTERVLPRMLDAYAHAADIFHGRSPTPSDEAALKLSAT